MHEEGEKHMPEADFEDHEKKGRLKIIGLVLLGLVIMLVAGLYLAYAILTRPVMSVKEMEDAFAKSRAFLQSASPERLQLGKEYVALLAELPQRPLGDWYIKWDSQEYRQGARKWLEASSAYLEELHALTARGPGAIELDLDEGLNTLAPSIQQPRAPARLLRIDMEDAAEAGDGARVLRDAKAVDCIAQTIEHRNVFISHLVAIACRSIALSALIEERTKLDDATIKELIAWLERAEKSLPPPADAFLAEMIVAEWMYRKGFSSFDLDKPLFQAGQKGFFSRLSLKQTSILVRVQQDVIEAAKLPPRQAIPELKRIVEDVEAAVAGSKLKKMDYVLAAKLLPAMKTAYSLMIIQVARYRGARIVLALELYRRTHKAYPEELTALVPEFIESLPADPFTDEAFKYLREGDEYRLYSIGANLEDDGGQEVVPNDDYIIFPQEP